MKLKKRLLALCSALCVGVASTALSGCFFGFGSNSGDSTGGVGNGGSVIIPDDGSGDNGGGIAGDNPIVDTTVGTEGLVYELSENGTYYSVVGYEGTETDIVIPNTYENLPVTSIGDEAFFDCGSLMSVVIADSVTSIGYRAFYNCSKLTSVTFENPNGWSVDDDTDDGEPLSGESLSDTATAAEYLSSTYRNYDWKRSE